MSSIATVLYLVAAFISFLVSALLWFVYHQMLDALFVATWVPAILSLGAFLNTRTK